MELYIVYGILFVKTANTKIKACNALNAMFVKTVNTGVCGSYTSLYTEYSEVVKTLLYCVYRGLWPLLGGKASCYLKSLSYLGVLTFSPVSLRRQLIPHYLDLSTTMSGAFTG